MRRHGPGGGANLRLSLILSVLVEIELGGEGVMDVLESDQGALDNLLIVKGLDIIEDVVEELEEVLEGLIEEGRVLLVDLGHVEEDAIDVLHHEELDLWLLP